MKSIILSAVIAIAMLSSCNKKDVLDVNNYKQNYSITYDAVKSKTSVVANFILPGTTVKSPLMNGSTIVLNGNVVNAAYTNSPDYYSELNGLTDLDIVLSKSDGKKVSNRINFTSIHTADFPQNFPKVVSKSQGLSFNWVGQDVVSTEKVIVRIWDTTTAIPTKIFNTPAQGQNVNFTSDDLKKLRLGKILVYIVRSDQVIDLINKDNNEPATAIPFYSTYKEIEVIQ